MKYLVFFSFKSSTLIQELLSTHPFFQSSFLSIVITEKNTANTESSSSSLEHENPIIADKAQPKLHAQKRGGNETGSTL